MVFFKKSKRKRIDDEEVGGDEYVFDDEFKFLQILVDKLKGKKKKKEEKEVFKEEVEEGEEFKEEVEEGEEFKEEGEEEEGGFKEEEEEEEEEEGEEVQIIVVWFVFMWKYCRRVFNLYS